MKWFKRWVAKQCEQAWVEARNNKDIVTRSVPIAAGTDDWHDNLNIAITTAIGGRIVTFRRYDHKLDRSDNHIYVIPDDQNFDQEFTKIISIESLR